jgi:uncharacterized protein YjbJ (UPF0337 family)
VRLDNLSASFQKKGRVPLTWDCKKRQGKKQRDKAVIHWGKMMCNELAENAGKNEEFVGKLQEKCGIAKEVAG